MIPLTLCPLMSGEMSQKDRIRAAFSITREVTSVDLNEIRKIEAMIYTMADKFLDKMSMEEIVEEVNKDLQSYKKITMVTVVDEPLPMTSTKKVKRFEVVRKYKED